MTVQEMSLRELANHTNAPPTDPMKAEGYRDLFSSIYRYTTTYINAKTEAEFDAAAQELCNRWHIYQNTPLEKLATELFNAVYSEIGRRSQKNSGQPVQKQPATTSTRDVGT